MEELEPGLRALADPHRRTLLDRLRDRDGQTLGELEAALPQMTRFGVMKHLRVLEGSRTSWSPRRDGRRKLHFLNPVPIRLIADRWISRYAEPLVEAMADIKHTVEKRTMSESPKHVYEVYIAATPEQVWAAITESEFTKQYYYDNHRGVGLAARLHRSSTAIRRRHRRPIQGEIIEADPPRRLVHTFFFPGTDEVTLALAPGRSKRAARPPLLILTHDDFDGETSTYRSVAHGWVPILSGLNTLLETGKALEISYPAAEGVRD